MEAAKVLGLAEATEVGRIVRYRSPGGDAVLFSVDEDFAILSALGQCGEVEDGWLCWLKCACNAQEGRADEEELEEMHGVEKWSSSL